MLVMHPNIHPGIAGEPVSCIGTGSLISTTTMQWAAVAEQKARLLDRFHFSRFENQPSWRAASWKQERTTTHEATQQSLAAVYNSATLEGSLPVPSTSLGHSLDQAAILCWMMPSPSFESYPAIEPEPPPWPLQCAV